MPVSSGKIRSLLLAIMLALCLARSVTAWLGDLTLSEVTLSAWTLIGLFAAVAALRFAMRGAKVDAEHLCAALSAYLLAGLYFGLLYWASNKFTRERSLPAIFPERERFTTASLHWQPLVMAI
jgi:voltage-gated potassium channel